MTYPEDSELVTMLTAYLVEGHALLAGYDGNHLCPYVFVSRHRTRFSDATFTTYWEGLIEREGLSDVEKSFPPIRLRTSFVSSYTNPRYGRGEDEWEGAANIMGTSVRQFKAVYAPDLRAHQSQQAVDAHAAFRDRVQQG